MSIEYEDGRIEKLWSTEARIANGTHHGGVELVESQSLDSGEIVIQAVTGTVVESFPHRIGEDATTAYAVLYAILAGLTLSALLVYRRVRDADASTSKPVAFPAPSPSESD